MLWYKSNFDGTASVYADTPAVRARIDAREPGWFGTAEGAILHGGVIATAFQRRTEPTCDGRIYFATGKLVSMGDRAVTTITATCRPRPDVLPSN